MNFKEIISKLKELEITPSDLGDWDYDKESLTKELGEFEEVYSVGNTEGGGDYSASVFYFKDHDVYLQITGFYSSYNGTDWDEDFKSVASKQKTITVYE